MTSQLGEQRGRTTELEVLTLGQAGVDVYPQQVDVRLERVDTFRKYLGGAAANVAVAAAALGRSAAIISTVGDDPFGRFVARTFRDLPESSAAARNAARTRAGGGPRKTLDLDGEGAKFWFSVLTD